MYSKYMILQMIKGSAKGIDSMQVRGLKMDSIIKMIGSRFNDVDHISTSTLSDWLLQPSEPPPSHSTMSENNVKDDQIPESNCGKSVDTILKQQNVVLLDTRAQKEFVVSHLENAIWVGEKPTETQVADLMKDYLNLDDADEIKPKVDTTSDSSAPGDLKSDDADEIKSKEDKSNDSSVPGAGSSYDPGRSVRFVCYCALGYRSSQLAQKIQVTLNSCSFPRGASVHNLEGSIIKWANEGRPMVDNEGESTKFCHPYNTVFGLTLNKDLRKYE